MRIRSVRGWVGVRGNRFGIFGPPVLGSPVFGSPVLGSLIAKKLSPIRVVGHFDEVARPEKLSGQPRLIPSGHLILRFQTGRCSGQKTAQN